MKSQSRVGAWTATVIGSLYLLIPLIATFEFSLRMKRGTYSFEAYSVVLSDPRFQASFGYSILMALLTIVVGIGLLTSTFVASGSTPTFTVQRSTPHVGLTTVSVIGAVALRPWPSVTVAIIDFGPVVARRSTFARNEKTLSPAVWSPFVPSS